MVEDVTFQLEALREAKNWSTWVVGLASTALAGFAIFKEKGVESENVRDAKSLLVASAIAFLCALSLEASVPYIIEQLPIPTKERHYFFGLEFSGVYAYNLLELIPLWVLQTVLHVAIVTAGFFGLSILWRELFNHSFLDWGRRKRGCTVIREFRKQIDPSYRNVWDHVFDPGRKSLKESIRNFTRPDIEQAIRDFLLVQRHRDLDVYNAMIHRIEELKESEKKERG